MYKVGGREYPLKTSRSCKVCSSPWRSAVENALISGFSYEKIVSSLPEDTGLTQDNVKSHYKNNHLPLQEDVRRRLIESRAAELQWDVDSAAGQMVDAIGFLRSGLQDVLSRMSNREIEPDIKDGIAMARILTTLDVAEQTEQDMSQYRTAMQDMLDAARDTMTPEQYAAYSQRILNSAAMRSLLGRDERPREIEAHED